jgi:arsenate reductase-like glutaredoxin family protein
MSRNKEERFRKLIRNLRTNPIEVLKQNSKFWKELNNQKEKTTNETQRTN